MPSGTTIANWLDASAKKLVVMDVPTPARDARVLLQDVLDFTSAELISRSGEVLENEAIGKADEMLSRRMQGEPVYRILGWREFFGRRFSLSAETLEPRPDTEILVEAVLKRVSSTQKNVRILDLGTGTGVIGITLAAELENANVVSTDISEDALASAADNAKSNQVSEKIRFQKSNLFENVAGRYSFIVSNPPYIPDAELRTLQREVQEFDPSAALAGGKDGLDFYRAIFSDAGRFLESNGEVWVEFGLGQEVEIEKFVLQAGYEVIGIFCDLSGIKRVLGARLKA